MKEIEVEGKTVTIAVESGLGELGLKRDQVEVEVLDQGAPGILGFGAKPARVRIRAKEWGEGEIAQPQTPKSQPSTAGTSATAEPSRPPRQGPRPEPRPERRQREVRPREERRAPPPPQREERRPQPSRPVREPSAPVDTAKACQVAEETLKEVLSLALLPDATVRCA